MRRAQTLLRNKAFRPLTRGVSNFLRETNKSFARIRQAPELEWGISHVFNDSYSGMGQGQFLDKRAVVVGGNKVVDDTTAPTDDAWVFSASGETVTALPAFPNNGGFLILSATLGDGRILFCGGSTGIKTRTLHPGTLLWTSQPDMGGNAVSGYTLVTLASGHVLRIGGVDNLAAPVATVEMFNQGSNTWSAKASMAHARVGCVAVLLADGRVLVTAGGVATAEIYDPVGNSWAPTANQPQAGNRGFMLLTTDAGETYAADSNSSFILYIDRFNLITNSFVPLATMSGSFQSISSSPGSQLLFDIGGGFLVMVLKNFFPRDSYYDIKTNTWFEKQFNYPEPLPVGDCLFHITKNTFLMLGGQTGGFLVPHHVGHYSLLSTFKKDDGGKPTFAGLVSVRAGSQDGRVYLSWAPGSDAKTFVNDLNYYVYYANSSGGQDFNSPNVTTQAWAGSKGIELFGLTPDTDYYFVVRARDMDVFETFQGETPIAFNLDTNLVEVHFHTPATPAAPTWNWTAAASMSQPRKDLQGYKIGWGPINPASDVSRYMVFGGTNAGVDPIDGDIYSIDGQEVERITNITTSLQGAAVVHSDVTINDAENRYGAIVGGLQGGTFRTDSVARYNPYSPGFGSIDGFFSNSHSSTPSMQEAVEGHVVGGIEVNDLLRAGGETVSGVTNTAERLFYRTCQRVPVTAQTSPFTVGATLTGLTSGTTGIIRQINPFGFFGGPELIVSDVVGGFWVQSEEITDSSGGDAFAAFFSNGPYYLQEWAFVSPMLYKRRDHSVVEAHIAGSDMVLVAGGVDDNGLNVRTMEAYDKDFDIWRRIPGILLPYTGATGGGSPMNSGVYIASGTTFSWGRLEDDNPHPILTTTGVLTFGTDEGSVLNILNGEAVSGQNIAFSFKFGTFTPGETITGGTSGATAVVYAVPVDGFTGVLVYGSAVGGFSLSETITGGTSGTTAVIMNLLGTDKEVTTSAATQEKIRPHVKFAMVKLPPAFGYSKVLLIGGEGNFGGNSALDIFDPQGPDIWSGGQVTHGANLPSSRSRHTAHLFADGSVGVFGGQLTGGAATNDVRLYNPGGDTWSHPAGINMTTKRAGHVSFMLPNNTVLVVGGEDDTFTALASAEISGP